MNPDERGIMRDGIRRVKSAFFPKPRLPDLPGSLEIFKRQNENQGNTIQKAIEEIHGKMGSVSE
jgi:hypothetical protein